MAKIKILKKMSIGVSVFGGLICVAAESVESYQLFAMQMFLGASLMLLGYTSHQLLEYKRKWLCEKHRRRKSAQESKQTQMSA